MSAVRHAVYFDKAGSTAAATNKSMLRDFLRHKRSPLVWQQGSVWAPVTGNLLK